MRSPTFAHKPPTPGKHETVTYAKLKASGPEPRLGNPRFSPSRLLVRSPDFGTPRRLVLLALAVTLIMGVWLGVTNWDNLNVSYGDTDDATRLVAVRAMLNGRGWWDQLVTRFQPPVGLWMHWSRLLDGGIAGLDRVFRLALSADDAEFATRFTWPLLWIFPAALATLVSAQRLGRGAVYNAAVIVAAVILASDLDLYIQFRPGRIDHHDVQMTFTFLALAGAMMRSRVKGALIAGVATALGAAVGLESLVFSAAIGAMLALRFGFYRAQAGAAQAYGLSLAIVTTLAFAIQTPPWRWGVEVCDAMAWNLCAAILVAGLGVAALARFGAGLRWPLRLVGLVVIGAASGATYLALYPHCIHGFFADVDPRIRPIWLNYVQEVRPIASVLKHNLADGVGRIAIWAVGGIAWLLLALRAENRRDFAFWLSGLLLAMGAAAGASAIRMTGYAEWFAVPVIAAAATEVLGWSGYRNWLAVVLAAAVASPVTAEGIAATATNRIAPLLPSKSHKTAAHGTAAHGPVARKTALKKTLAPADRCFDIASFDTLADSKPTGVVLGEVDLGPLVLATTQDSALAGPYHRMGWGILRAHAILKADADSAAAPLARRAGIAYVVECRMHSHHGDRADMTKAALQKRLDAGQPPAWLQPLSTKNEPLQVYRVLPPGVIFRPAPAGPVAQPAPASHAVQPGAAAKAPGAGASPR